MGDENHIRTLGDYSKPNHEGYRNTIELPVENNVVPLRSDTIRLVQNGCSFHGLWSEDPNQHLKDLLKLVDSLDLDGSITTWEDLTTQFLAQFFLPGRTVKLRNDILMFQQRQDESLYEVWTRFKDLLLKVPHHGLDLWLQVQIFYDHVDYTTQMAINYEAGGRLRKLRPKVAWKNIEGRKSQTIQRIYGSNYGRFHATLFEGHKEVKGKDNRRGEHDEKDREDNKPGTNNNRNVKSRYDVENLDPQSNPQVLSSFKEYTPPVTYPKGGRRDFRNPDRALTQLSILRCKSRSQRGPEPPIKLHSSDSFRMKEVDSLTIHTPPSPHVASFHLKDLYCYYHPCLDDPKKHYGFKPGLLGYSGSLGVDFLNFEMIEDDQELESKEVSFLGRRLNLPVIFDKKKLEDS
ncbi:zinc finger, CCHC-type containing protein [Tanacetum coccineum]